MFIKEGSNDFNKMISYLHGDSTIIDTISLFNFLCHMLKFDIRMFTATKDFYLKCLRLQVVV